MINKIFNEKNAFTLVELLAVIVVLSMILTMAVPRIMRVIENSKKRTFEATARSIAKSAEEVYIENDSFGITNDITCESLVEMSKKDYESCIISFDSFGKASVTIIGKGSYKGLAICNGTKTESIVQESSCPTE